MIINRLKAAEPTIVEGPSFPLWNPFLMVSIMESKISGADEPNAMSVRFATVSFHNLYVLIRFSDFTRIRSFFRVTSSIEATNLSAMMATPKKIQHNAIIYKVARNKGDQNCSAGIKGKMKPPPPG